MCLPSRSPKYARSTQQDRPSRYFHRSGFGAQHEHAQLHLVPTSGTLSQLIIGQGADYLPLIYAGIGYLPQLWEVDYISGFDAGSVPRIIVDAICKLAVIAIATIASDLIHPLRAYVAECIGGRAVAEQITSDSGFQESRRSLRERTLRRPKHAGTDQADPAISLRHQPGGAVMGVQFKAGVQIGGAPIGGSSGGFAYKVTSPFDRAEFEAVLRAHGSDVSWEQTAVCPNHGGDPVSDHKLVCTVCQHRGRLTFKTTDTRVLMQSVELQDSYYQYGRWDSGSVMVTALPEQRLHQWDILTVKCAVARFDEVVRRTNNDVDYLKYPPIEILYAAVVRGETLHVFDVEADFVVEDRTVRWLTTQRPRPGTQWTVVYHYRPVYVVDTLLKQHRKPT